MTVEDRLRDAEAPDAVAARERARRVIVAATPAPEPRRNRLARAAAVATGAAVLLLGALTPPGEAVADWLGDLIEPVDHTPPPPRPVLGSLPADGRLLVSGREGAWVVGPDGTRDRLGDYDQATWSPQGLFVAATRGSALFAVEPTGTVRWRLDATGDVRDPSWAPSGYRIAYRVGSSERIVAGDGSGDRALVADVAEVAPAWRPSMVEHELALTRENGALELWDAGAGRWRWRRYGVAPLALGWMGAGHLVVVRANELQIIEADGESAGVVPLPGAAVTAAAVAPDGRTVALARGRAVETVALDDVRRPPTELEETHVVGAPPTAGADDVRRPPFRRGDTYVVAGRPVRRLDGAGAITGLAFSPDGAQLLAASDPADQWVFVPISRGTVSSVTVRGYPQLGGWCCSPDLMGGAPRFAPVTDAHTRVSRARRTGGGCAVHRVAWASTVRFRDGAFQLPPARTVRRLGPGDALVALSASRDSCTGEPAVPPRGTPNPALTTADATVTGWPGRRRGDPPLRRVDAVAPGGYAIDAWIFARDAAGLARADALLRTVQWPARLG